MIPMSSFDMVEYLEANFKAFWRSVLLIDGQKSHMSKQNMVWSVLFLIFLNQFITSFVFFNWFILVVALTL